MLCTKCGEDRAEISISGSKADKNSSYFWCRDCVDKINNDSRNLEITDDNKSKNTTNKQKVIVDVDVVARKAKERMLKSRYNLTLNDYHAMYIDQDKKCAICGNEKILGTNRGLVVDHDHVTNEVRGLLCYGCNYVLGIFKDNPQLFSNAISYLTKNQHG